MGLTLDSYYKNWKVPYEEGQKTRWGISEKYLIVCFARVLLNKVEMLEKRIHEEIINKRVKKLICGTSCDVIDNLSLFNNHVTVRRRSSFGDGAWELFDFP